MQLRRQSARRPAAVRSEPFRFLGLPAGKQFSLHRSCSSLTNYRASQQDLRIMSESRADQLRSTCCTSTSKEAHLGYFFRLTHVNRQIRSEFRPLYMKYYAIRIRLQDINAYVHASLNPNKVAFAENRPGRIGERRRRCSAATEVLEEGKKH
jgi:hypothetical protein